MSERKVLNKYYPPDFDPAKIPRMKLAKNRQYTVRLMAPFNMRCVTCGEYIYKGKKFNARKEDVEDQTYLGIRIYRFYIKCTRCLQEISFKTDPQNTDYEIEAGATRNFMALKLAEEQAQRELDELKEEEANNPMKLLENRTEQSRNEIELLESLEELRDLNRRQQAVDYDTMLLQFNPAETEEEREKRLQLVDEEYIKTVQFRGSSSGLKRFVAEEVVEDVKDEKVDATTDVLPAKRPTFEEVKKEQLARAAVSAATASTAMASVGGFTKTKVLMKNLVQKKSVVVGVVVGAVTASVKPTSTPAQAAATEPTPKVSAPKTNALSMLSGYSDSEDSNGDQ